MRRMTLKEKGDLAELMVACDLRRRGCKIAIPFGEECDYDLVIERDGKLERVQVKHELGNGRREILLRVTRAKNNQRARIRLARDYLDLALS